MDLASLRREMIRLRRTQIKDLIYDEVFEQKEVALPPTIRTALRDFIVRIADNPDNPDLIGVERGGFRATQFTSGWVLDWEVTRRRRGRMVELFSYGKPEQVKLWDIRNVA